MADAPKWPRLLRGLASSQEEVFAQQEQRRATREGGTPVAQLVAGRPARVSGGLRSVILRPRSSVPALEAELFDGSGSLLVIWLGRREIAGIQAGVRIRVHGMVTTVDAQLVMYNPRYELLVEAA